MSFSGMGGLFWQFSTTASGSAGSGKRGFIADGLFIGQSSEFLQLLVALAEEADAAERRRR